ncbi:MAG: hypothetical protein A3B89_02285 [Candidatus Buchananbacteria bacterium RIFCSPHIGHO2_02_FULL_40_13]|uniref:Dephospho-CoA kinase n=1 Tax=Candidatus Buchananbacteria bacterium RIFCSPLOWO2_01_FULL_39_33 TaxID=1797543 RepID=A0A1G1YJD6_9BACT|nr:MAG: hypothetical protein A3B89_02285 [Candidatus Buchananbacteria bacterium RIFCSPHIGHO2_02_FULL_40_13]OGY52384.1 MAG: hypothetical protein A3A02_02785 [Candidatus Buchananbacteria bacterium RIFCSPLOWO2_01_FULL_39_33]
MKVKVILGLVGEIASGKDTVANYLAVKYHSQTISFSEPLRQILNILGLPQNRQNLVWLGVDLGARFGQDILAKVITNMVQASQTQIICLPNVRLESDIIFLENLPGFYLIGIETDQVLRYQRLVLREQNTDDQTKSWEEFLADSQLPTEIAIGEMARRATFNIDNNGELAELYGQVEHIMASILKVKGLIK